MKTRNGIAPCLMCGRGVTTKNGRYKAHSMNEGHQSPCRMVDQNVPITGMSDADHEDRARIVGELAAQVQDADPTVVWDYLRLLPREELQRLMMFALAAIPIDQTIGQMFAWVADLPAAQLNPEEATA